MATDAQQQQHKTVTGTTIGGVVAMIRAKMTGVSAGGSGAKAEDAHETAPETDPKKTDGSDAETEPATATATATESGTEAESAQAVETAAATGGAPAPDAGVANAAAAAGAAAGANAGGFDVEAVLAIAGDDDAFLVKAVRAKMDAKTAAEAYVKHLRDENAALKAEIGKAAESAGGAGAAGSSKSPKFVSAKAGAPVKLSIAGAARADGAAGAGGGGGAGGAAGGIATVAAQIEAAERALQNDPERLNAAIAQIQSQRPGMSRTDAMVELKKMIAAEIQTSVA